MTYPLKRYLESLIAGGYYDSIIDIEGILFLVDPMTVPEEYFPYLCESFGFKYFPDIDIYYQRKFLSNLGELNRRKGTYSCVQYLAKALTGLDSELKLEDGVLHIIVLAKNVEQLNNINTSMKVIERYIENQIPYFISPAMSSRITTQVIVSKSYAHSAVGSYKFYNICGRPNTSGPDNSSGGSNTPDNYPSSNSSALGTGKLGNFILGGN